VELGKNLRAHGREDVWYRLVDLAARLEFNIIDARIIAGLVKHCVRYIRVDRIGREESQAKLIVYRPCGKRPPPGEVWRFPPSDLSQRPIIAFGMVNQHDPFGGIVFRVQRRARVIWVGLSEVRVAEEPHRLAVRQQQ
jgi:hypothetical protein